ncbi:isoprenylcysteine carboxylmethyltransferase family protein [candidate division KSB1 bacterium]|nr:isoprenylcysteine carboxylmethyltransferase family protein [candidate division KSB1 bacterium]
MSTKAKIGFVPMAWLLNLIIVFEIIYMTGLAFFLIGAGQIYYAKFAKKGGVSDGLYKFIRHPQYVAFAVMGLGLLFAWPRFTVLLMYVTMLFVYYFLARHEERECEVRYGEGYRIYKEKTAMFIPGNLTFFDKLPSLPKSGWQRATAIVVLYLVVIALTASAGMGIRKYALSKISTHYPQDAAVIAVAAMSEAEIKEAMRITFGDQQVQYEITAAGYSTGEKLLIHIVPLNWYLADLPLEEIPPEIHGHHQPKPFDRNQCKILFTKAKLFGNGEFTGDEIITKTFAREPIVVAKIDMVKGKVMAVETPPAHVVWGNIRTPLF